MRAPIAIALLLTACSAAKVRPPAPHPWEGKVWDVRAARFVAPEAITTAVRNADYVFLGEKHDNPFHHEQQALLIAAAADGKPMAVTFEQVPANRQTVLDTFAATHPTDATGLEATLDWAHTGWPAWAMYAQVFTAAIRTRGPLVAGDVPRDWLKLARQGGLAALPVTWRTESGLLTPLTPEERALLWNEINRAHCGYAPTNAVDKLVNIQRLRDAHLAMAMKDHSRAVLIAGLGHARADVGAPAYLRKLRPGARMVSVGLLPTGPGLGPEDLRGAPFDYLWFTPDTEIEDPCKKYEQELKRMHAPH